LVLQAPALEADQSAGHDVPNSASSEPNTAVVTGLPAETETISSEQADVAVSAANTVAQLPGDEKEEKELVRSTDSPILEQLFSSEGTISKLEVKSNLSSMFKSLSAKIMMKRGRPSRFSDIASVVGVSSESVAVSESSQVLIRTDAGSGCGSAAENLPVAVGNESETLTFGTQNYHSQEMTGISLSSMPICPPPLPPGLITAAQNNSIAAMTHTVPAVMPTLPGW